MLLEIMKSKIHRVKLNSLELDYVGSICIDEALLEAASILPNEKVQVLNLNTGTRFETYAIVGKRNSGIVGLNGPAARMAALGDTLIIIAYALMTPEEAKNYQPIIIFPNEENRLSE
ncbi:MAG: aspartate 1-decarboxylase [Bacteroidia bacterium]|nr:aspartate 1-decarboxylase [Bacteroidia bacterium]MDW8159117.1 aspartate 1-decarboxylase [Bacteroidia bacterium]